MIGWFSPSEIIIVHTGQIVVDETHGVDHFDRDGSRHGLHEILVGFEHLTSGETEHGSDALSSRH